MGLCTEPDAVCRPACLALSDRLRQQAVTQSAPPRRGRGDHAADGGAAVITNAGCHDAGIGRQVIPLTTEQMQHAVTAIQPVQILEGTGLLHHEHLGAQGKQLIQFIRGQLGPGFHTPVHE